MSRQTENPCVPAGERAKGDILFHKREYPPLNPPREGFSHCKRAARRAAMLADATSCARRCRVGIAIRFASASIIRCRSAYLIEVRSNPRLPRHYSMRRALAMPHSARSLPPSNRHSRLTIVRRGCKTKRIAEDSWRSHVHRTRFRRLSSSSRSRLPMCGVEGKGPSSLSLGGCKGGYSLSEERE